MHGNPGDKINFSATSFCKAAQHSYVTYGLDVWLRRSGARRLRSLFITEQKMPRQTREKTLILWQSCFTAGLACFCEFYFILWYTSLYRYVRMPRWNELADDSMSQAVTMPVCVHDCCLLRDIDDKQTCDTVRRSNRANTMCHRQGCTQWYHIKPRIYNLNGCT